MLDLLSSHGSNLRANDELAFSRSDNGMVQSVFPRLHIRM